jgi:hypothetical protein
MRIISAQPGEHLLTFAQRVVAEASVLGHPLLARHNDHSVYVFPQDDAGRVAQTLYQQAPHA